MQSVRDVFGESGGSGHVDGFGDVAECAFADVHQLAVTPMGTYGEVGCPVVGPVEEESFAAGWEAGRCETLAYDADEEVAVVDVVAALVRPFAVWVFPAA